MEGAVTSTNAFNLKLLQTYRSDNEKGNIFYSPTSIAIALAMLYTGAQRKTKKDIENVLSIEGSQSIHEGFSSLFKSFNDLPSETVLNIANMLALDKKYKVLSDFSNNLKSNYNAETKLCDFESNSKQAQAELNQWVEFATNDKIKDFFRDDSISPETCLVLINAIYFKGLWSISFNKDNTTKKPFYTITNEEVMVDMMFRRAVYRMSDSEDLNARLLELPYIGGRLSMILLLPLEKNGISFIESNISVDNLNKAIQNLSKVNNIHLSLPRFKLDESLPLKQCLIKMGMKDAFTSAADFSGISGSTDTYVSAALHKAFVEVNEEGTEASAVTGMVKIAKCSGPPPPPIVFNVNHPFMFVIREMNTGLDVFIGSIQTL